ncbi:MAG: molybdopterin-dependent oxidoreductase, partial [Planctomycetes bacterium]|nr:molybdopterin-dependent oxidoreductase [Planctomycetota bacterium]
MSRSGDPGLEPERYELLAGPAYRFDLDRREFLKAAGGGLVVLLLVRGAPALQDRGRGSDGPTEIGAWLRIGEDGTITAYTGKAEVGQDIRTSLAQAVAEELRVPPEAVRLVMADTDLTPYDAGTFGSRTTPNMSRLLRRAAAASRELLRRKAADLWGVSREEISVEKGRLLHAASSRSAGFGEITKGEALAHAIEEGTPTTPPEEWRTLGRSVPKANGEAIVTGRHRYASDVRRPGMLFGKVLRPGAFGASLGEVDASAARAIEGVTVVADGDCVGVAASSADLAERALAAIRAEWKTPPHPSSETLFAYLNEHPSESRERGRRGPTARGSLQEGFAASDAKHEATYTLPYIAHAPLEPRAAVAEWAQGRLTVWTGTQRPFGVRSELAEALRIPEDKVRVIVPDTGSGYGGKHTGEAAIEAARLARAAGKPVGVFWTREEEFTWAYFRPAGVIEVKSGVAKDGRILAWEFHNRNSGGSGIETPYEVPHQHVEFHASASPLRQGSYRALAATANHFARETHLDEIARTLAIDPLAVRRANLQDRRLLAVLEAAAERGGWAARTKASGRGFGLACGVEKGGYVASCAEVEAGPDHVRVLRVTTAFECGAIVHPDNLRNQVEGAVLMGIGGALFESVRFAEGRMLNPRFSQYRVPRFRDVPALETVLLDRRDLP